MSDKFFVFPLLILSIFWINSDADPSVQLSQGKLNGTVQKSRSGRNYSAFFGIPYAEPPVGDLRFKNPLPAKGWNGTRQANVFGNICPQNKNGSVVGNEDCLFLNVYTPHQLCNSALTNSTLLPVMVWIHGGAFTQGSSNEYTSGYLLDKDIVLVTMNYRLSIFGFLSTGNSAAPGNFGLKDQVVALKWVQQNIKEFGGDPSRVTLFGESAGGASVSLHAISKASNGLFQQYIIQSGAALCPWAHQKKINFQIYVRELALLVGCPFITSESLVDCLRKKNVETLMKTDSIFSKIARIAQLTWTPTDEPDVEGAFLIDSPRNLINNNQMKDLPSMSGVVTDEGLLITSTLYKNDVLYTTVRMSINGLINFVAGYYLDVKSETYFTAAVDKFYFDNKLITSSKDKFLQGVTRFTSDGFFHYPQLRVLEKVTPGKKTSNYFYSFGYRSTEYNSYGGTRNIGVGHAEELIYLFPVPSASPLRSPSDISISELMVDLWTSFAINGKPTSNKLNQPDMWLPYSTQNNNHLQIGNISNNVDPSVTLSNMFFPDRMDFWKRNVPI